MSLTAEQRDLRDAVRGLLAKAEADGSAWRRLRDEVGVAGLAIRLLFSPWRRMRASGSSIRASGWRRARRNQRHQSSAIRRSGDSLNKPVSYRASRLTTGVADGINERSSKGCRTSP